MEKKRKVIPPVYLLLSLILMFLLQRFFPVYQFVEPPDAYLGIVPVLFGISVAAFSASLFRKANTGIEPFSEASTLVTNGFYRISRNPMYVGMFMMLLGFAFLMGGVGALLPLPVFVLIIRNRFVLGEERFLEESFGQRYLEYKSQVRRWI
jgi:protein-S-isoprenylcysteine O-methyltransferase Ste14